MQHICEHKVRLTEQDDAFLRELDRRIGAPPAVLARMFIKQAMDEHHTRQLTTEGRRHEGLMCRR